MMPSRRADRDACRTARRCRRARPSRRRAGSDGHCAGACDSSWYHDRGVADNPTVEEQIARYERIWDWRGALGVARAAGDLPGALRYAIELRDDAATAELLAQLTATDDGARAALAVLVRMRRHADAAPLAERLGQTDEAIDLYTRARRELD